MSQGEQAEQAHRSMTSEQAPPAPVVQQEAASSCRKKKSESGTFFGDVSDHVQEFFSASMEEHKTCFKKTMNKFFGMSKAVSNGTGTTSSSTVPVENVMSRPATTE